ncbi:MAG: hypothetical protein DRI75_10905 [Bacteroidetes bacterium]|nr:MAG: hypothetical protein DRI75_10905 [Bacteroidota bacterium]
MNQSIEKLYGEALEILRGLTTSSGIFASTIDSDNYKRVWARDSIISGIAGLLAEDNIVIEGLKQSLLTLAKHQHALGIIPSNVLVNEAEVEKSYGSLVGRVDTNTWFIIGACLHYLNTKDEKTWQSLMPSILKSRTYLKTIEFNEKGWIYTPLSGNWADEYPIHGYTLYDNCLRIWGESLWLKINKQSSPEFEKLKSKTLLNFWPKKIESDESIYQKKPFIDVLDTSISHFCSSILPGKYDTRFDAAGNAIALLNFNLNSTQKENIKEYLFYLKNFFSKMLIPAFWPVIKEDDKEWEYLKDNYSFSFKNKPYNFHNGGIWPVWIGFFCLGLSNNDLIDEVKLIIQDFISVIASQNWNFNEFITGDHLKLNGKEQMGFSASGIVFMKHALNFQNCNQKLGL